MKWRAFFGLVVLCSFLLTACMSMSPAATDEDGLSDEQVLRLTETNQISGLDSAKYVDIVSWNVLYNVNEGLMRLGKENKPVYGIAEDVQISPDKKVYTFKLREDAVWSDGEPVTARDFEYAWKRALNPKTKSEYAYILYSIVGAEEYNKGVGKAEDVGVKAVDDQTLVVKLKKPQLTFLSLTTQSTYFPQRQDIVENYGDEYSKSPDKMVYNGPFVLQSVTPQKVVLKKNENYWDANTVSLNRVEIIVAADTPKRISLYNSGQADTAKLDQEFVSAYIQTPDYLNMELASSQFILLNQRNKILRNDNIRRAISLAIDREEIAHQVLKDGSKPAGALVPPALYVDNQSYRKLAGQTFVKQDVDKAKKYFQRGLRELGLSKPPTSLTLLSFDDHRKYVALSIKKQLREVLGLEVKLDSVPRKLKVPRELKGEFDLTMSSWFADYSDPIGFLEIWKSESGLNYMAFKNPIFDRLIEKAGQSADQKKKTSYLAQAEKLLVGEDREAALVPLYYEANSFLQKPYVKDLYRHPYGAEYDLKWAYISKQKK
jgi:oligopeptide transport system substrate-binding protein